MEREKVRGKRIAEGFRRDSAAMRKDIRFLHRTFIKAELSRAEGGGKGVYYTAGTLAMTHTVRKFKLGLPHAWSRVRYIIVDFSTYELAGHKRA